MRRTVSCTGNVCTWVVLSSSTTAMSSDPEKASPEQTSHDEKGTLEQKSFGSDPHFTEVDLANYYEVNAGSLVVDPEYAHPYRLVDAFH